MKRKVLATFLAVLMLAAMTLTAFAASGTGTFNGETIAFSDWSNAAFGGWEQKEDGSLAPTELNDFVMFRLEKNLGSEYTVEFDVKQEDLTSGWQTIQIGFEVNAGENFTQSGLMLDLHNAGVARVITFGNANAGAGVAGSYENPYGGNAAYAPTTEWIHVKIQRTGSDFAVSVNDGTEKTISFTTDEYNGGHLVIGAVGSRMVSYKNFAITTPTQEDDVPKTGDGFQAALALGLLTAASLGVAAVTVVRKRELAE